MTDEFRDCFVGEKGYDALKKLMKNGTDLCCDVAKCLQERNDAEIAYAKALRKNSDALQKLAGRAKGTLSQAFTSLACQTSRESDAHNVIADKLLNEISIPMKSLAETQSKERKSVEETLNGKFKEWNVQKETDNKYRSRQFEKSKEIETLSIKMTEVSNTGKSSVRSKASSVSTPLVMSCVLPGGRHTSVSEKLSSNSDVKYHMNLEISMKKTEDELEKIERKYHTATKDVELLRQACDAEMYRSCDQLQKMELNRITEMENFIRTYANSIQILSETMNQVAQELYLIKVLPSTDIVIQARSNVQPTEIEILLYDIYAENESNVMTDYRRIVSLQRWIEILEKDIEIQQQTKNVKSSIPPLRKSNNDESSDDDRGSSSDGAMCSSSSPSKTDIVLNSVHHRDDSSSSSNDDDGAMHRTKREKKKKAAGEDFSSEIFVDRRGAALLEELYRASLYKIKSVYNRIKNASEPRYNHAQRLTRTFNDKGYPTTFLRIPCQPLTETPPSAPSTTKYFAQAMPIFVPTEMQQRSMAYSTQREAPPLGWAVNDVQLQRSAPVSKIPPQHLVYQQNGAPHNRMVQSGPTYPVLMVQAPLVQAPPVPYVQALYSYKAKHTDELDLEEGDTIELLERRRDEWFKGNLNGKIGLFPGNYVKEL